MTCEPFAQSLVRLSDAEVVPFLSSGTVVSMSQLSSMSQIKSLQSSCTGNLWKLLDSRGSGLSFNTLLFNWELMLPVLFYTIILK